MTQISRQLLQSETPFPEHFPAINLQQHHLSSLLNDILAILLPWQLGSLAAITAL